MRVVQMNLRFRSFTLDRQSASEVWSHCLRMRGESQHSKCNVCWQLERDLHDGNSPAHIRVQAAEALRKHYGEMYLDRCIYWSLRCLLPPWHFHIACDALTER